MTDYRGVEVSFTQAPKSIVCLSLSDTEVLFALGLDQEIIGVGEYCNYPEAAKKKTVLGSGHGGRLGDYFRCSECYS